MCRINTCQLSECDDKFSFAMGGKSASFPGNARSDKRNRGPGNNRLWSFTLPLFSITFFCVFRNSGLCVAGNSVPVLQNSLHTVEFLVAMTRQHGNYGFLSSLVSSLYRKPPDPDSVAIPICEVPAGFRTIQERAAQQVSMKVPGPVLLIAAGRMQMNVPLVAYYRSQPLQTGDIPPKAEEYTLIPQSGPLGGSVANGVMR